MSNLFREYDADLLALADFCSLDALTGYMLGCELIQIFNLIRPL